MNYRWKNWQVLFYTAVLAIALTACARANPPQDQTHMQGLPNGHMNSSQLHNPDEIPSYHGPKTQTTNEYGKTTSGMGTTVYSLIGSSSLHEGGVTAHVQSRLSSKGIENIKVFVLGDTIFLARSESGTSSSQYDAMQQKVLSQTEGLSGKGEPDQGIVGDTKTHVDDLAQANKLVQTMFDGKVNIVSITNPNAPKLIEQITSKLRASASDHSVAEDISKLLQMKPENNK